MSTAVIIYALCEPGTTRVRYIGKTILKPGRTIEQAILKRVRGHIANCNCKWSTHLRAWIRSLKERGVRPDLFMIDLGTDETWQDLERFHIASHRSAGYDLTNSAPGGEDAHHTVATAALVSSKLKGKPKSPQTRARMSAAMKGKPGHPGWMKARTHCKNGHEYSADNTYVDGRGVRWCRQCNRARGALFRHNAARKRQLLPPQTRPKIPGARRRTHCKRGHELMPENVYITPSTGDRQCKVCVRQRHAQQAARRKAMGPTPQPARTHCVNGHDYTPANRYMAPDGKSACRICQRERSREHYQRRKDRS